MRAKNDFIITNSTLYASHADYGEMVEQIQNYVTLGPLPIQCALFASTENPYEHFDRDPVGRFETERQHFSNGIYIGKLWREYGRNKDKTISGRFLLFKHPASEVYVIVTDGGTSFLELGLLLYIRRKYPVFTLPFFYSWEMEQMLNNLARSRPESVIMLTRLSRKSRLRSRVSRKKKESDLTWTDLPYKELFKQTRQSDAWMEKV
ncbi:unnamed protein product, partial [marine sediment metagenome]